MVSSELGQFRSWWFCSSRSFPYPLALLAFFFGVLVAKILGCWSWPFVGLGPLLVLAVLGCASVGNLFQIKKIFCMCHDLQSHTKYFLCKYSTHFLCWKWNVVCVHGVN